MKPLRKNSYELPISSLSRPQSEAGNAPLVLSAMRRRSGRRRAGRAVSRKRLGSAFRVKSAGGEAAAFRAEGQTRHFPVHGRRAQPSRIVRLQASVGEMERQTAAGGTHQG